MPRGCADLAPVESTSIPSTAATSLSEAMQNIRHELVDAQVEVLRIYVEKKSRERLQAALDRLIECTRVSFREEEELLERLTFTLDPRHRQRHDEVLARLELLRQDMEDIDRARLLAQLILVDRQLTSHISDVAMVPDGGDQAYLPECGMLSHEVGGARHQH